MAGEDQDESVRAAVARPGSPGWRRRRPRAGSPRHRHVSAWFTDEEYAVVLANAEAARLAPAAYVAAVSVAPTRPACGQVPDDEERATQLLHLLGLHRQMRGAAHNLNQAVAKLHSLNEPVGELPAIAGYVRRVATAVDELIAALASERV